MAKIDPTDTKTFEEHLSEIERIIDNRRRGWTLSTLAWDDVRQLLLIHVWKKHDTFQPDLAPFEHWLNRLISNQLTNILRDNMLKYARPCIRDGGCVFDDGDGHCSYTKSGKQCDECPLYAEWKERKENEHNIKSSLSLEHHAQEVNNIQSDFIDIEEKKRIIDSMMLEKLSTWEKVVYKLLYVENLTPAQASERLKKLAAKRKRPLKPTDAVEYQACLKEAKRFKDLMIDIIRNRDLI